MKLLLGLSIFLGVLTSAQESFAQQRFLMGYSSFSANQTPIWIAKEEGLFKRFGTEPDLILIEGGTRGAQALISGDLPIMGMSGQPVISARARGSDLTMIAGTVNKMNYVLVGAPSVKKPEDLKGKRIGAAQAGTASYHGVLLGLKHWGLDPRRDRITLLQLGNQGARVASLQSGGSDAIIVNPGLGPSLKERGNNILADFSELPISYPQQTVSVRERTLKIDPEFVYLGIISLSFTPGFVHASMAVGNTWFIRHRARAMTIISSAVPIGGTLLTPLLAMAVLAWGWRWGAILAGTLFLVLGIPLAIGVRPSPESMGLLPDGDLPRTQATSSSGEINSAREKSAEIDPTLREAMKTMVFWLFVIGMTVRVAAYSTISVHFVPIMVWKGLTQEHAAFLLGAFAFLNWAAHYVVGPLADAVNRPKLLAGCMLAAAGSMLLLIWGDGLWALWSFTILFTAIDASFPVVWATIGDFFGRKYFATIRGTMAFFYTWGGVVGPVIAGLVYDRSESYVATLWGICGILLLGCVLTALLINPWNTAHGKQTASAASG